MFWVGNILILTASFILLQIRKSKKRLRPEEAAEAIITSGPGTTMSLSAQTTPVNSSSGTTPSLSNSLPQISEEASDVSQDTRNSRKRSWVWKHFDEYTDRKVTKVKGKKDIVHESQRAKCRYCPKGPLGDYACDSRSNGNSGMLRHLKFNCKFYPGRKVKVVEKNQPVFSSDKSKGNTMKMVAYNPDVVMQACVEMVVVDELPFRFVEKQGFRHFCHVAVPLFKVPCRKTLVKNFLSLYDKTKKKLISDIKCHRVCLTTDTWTSVQNMNYMVLTAHFIDDKWEMHKRIINFCIISSHSGNSIGLLIEACLGSEYDSETS